MNSSGLWYDIRNNPLVLIMAVLLHVALIVMLSLNLINSEVPQSASKEKATIKAVVINSSKLDAELEKQKRKLQQQQQQQQQQKIAADNKRQQEEEKTQEEKKRQLVAQETKKQQIEQQQIEQQQREAKLRQATEEKKQAEEKKLAEEKQRKEAEVKQLAEQKRKEDEVVARRKQEEAELKRKLEEEERSEAEAQQQAERNRMLDSLRLQYVKLIEQKVERNWLRPATLARDVSCEVVVTQTIMGDVISVSLGACAADSAFQQSIERAVWKASPLPSAPNPDVFDREIHFTFRPK